MILINMKSTIQKDKHRIASYEKYNDYKNAWITSLKYSTILMKYIDSEDLYETCFVNYSQYYNELTRNRYNVRRNYTQIWDTMINTIRNEKNMRMAVRLLHQTNVQRNN